MGDIIRETLPPYRVEARIPLHLDACDDAIDTLVAVHQSVGEALGGNLQQEGDRGTAVWEVSGYALHLARSLMLLLRGGYVPAAMVTARALHEALVAVSTLADPHDTTIVARYFANQDLGPEAVRRSVQKGQRRAVKAGAQIDGDIRASATKLYGGLSGFAHSRRSAIRDALSRQPGTFAYGPHPDAHRKASHVSYGRSLIEHLVIELSFGLSLFEGFRETRSEIGLPLLSRLQRVGEEHPLSVVLD